MANIKKTYIASAMTTFTRLHLIQRHAVKLNMTKEYDEFIQGVLFGLDDYTEHCGVGSLYNAFTEQATEDILIGLNTPEKTLMVQSDSGGLQVITLGKTMTPEIKLGIYKCQATFSSHAMSFDKMPILVDEAKRHTIAGSNNAGQGMKMDHSLKYFVEELRFDAGRESGFNIKEQIEVFMKEKSDTKVMVIVQGWEIEDYNEYARGVYSVFNEMPDAQKAEYFEYIGGLSLATSGIIPYFQMFDLYCRAPRDLTEVPEEHRKLIHILGLGGPSKSGVLFALNNDFFGKDVHYTFDSTSHTGASTFGKYTKLVDESFIRDGEETHSLKLVSGCLGRDKDAPDVAEFMQKTQDAYEDLLMNTIGGNKLSRKEFQEKYSPWREDGMTGIKPFQEKFGEIEGIRNHLNAISLQTYLHFAMELRTYFDQVELFRKGDFHSIPDKDYRWAMTKLSKIKTYEEYMEQRETFKIRLKNKRKSTMTKVATVADFERICKEKDEEGINEDEW